MQGILSFGSSLLRGMQVRPVGLVDHDDIRQFHHASLDSLQFIPCSCQQNKKEEINHLVNRGFGLSHSNRLDKDVPVACRLTEKHRFPSVLRDAAERTSRWTRPDKCEIARSERGHAGFVTQNASARNLAAWINRQYGNLLPTFANQPRAQGFDQAALARPRNAGDPDSNRIAAMGKAVFNNALSEFAINRA